MALIRLGLYSITDGTADAMTAVFDPPITLSHNRIVFIEVTTPNLNGAITFAPDGLSAKPVKKLDNDADQDDPQPYDVAGRCIMMYDLPKQCWRLLTPKASLELNVGTDDAYAYTRVYPDGVTESSAGNNNGDGTSQIGPDFNRVQHSAQVQLNAPSVTKNGSEIATQAYADGLVAGLLDDRGSYNASSNLFPSTGGSGTAGAIKKGDIWYISVAGSLGGIPVTIGDSVRALVDSPAQTTSNWSVLETNIGYVPENVDNKKTTMTGNESSNIFYLTAKAIYDWATGLFELLSNKKSTITASATDYPNSNAVIAYINSLNLRRIYYTAMSGATAVTGSTANAVTYTFSVPANTFVAGNIPMITCRNVWTGTAAGKTMRIYINTTPDLSGTPFLIGTGTLATANLSMEMSRRLVIKSATETEVMPSTFSSGPSEMTVSSSPTIHNIPWTSQLYFVFAIQNASAADSGINSFVELTT
jgi:FlaG/FlaF family flagellin (archaellin)